METPPSIPKAIELAISIERKLHGRSLSSSDRTRVAAGAFAAALEHHHAIGVLFRERLNSSAFALVRAEYEAYVRGLWFAHCATDDQLSSFIGGAEPPKLHVLLEQIEALPTFESKTLSSIKAESWKSMCSYTHTGALQVQRWNTEDAITSRHSREEIEAVVAFCNVFALLAAVGVAALENNDLLATELLEKFRAL